MIIIISKRKTHYHQFMIVTQEDWLQETWCFQRPSCHFPGFWSSFAIGTCGASVKHKSTRNKTCSVSFLPPKKHTATRRVNHLINGLGLLFNFWATALRHPTFSRQVNSTKENQRKASSLLDIPVRITIPLLLKKTSSLSMSHNEVSKEPRLTKTHTTTATAKQINWQSHHPWLPKTSQRPFLRHETSSLEVADLRRRESWEGLRRSDGRRS